jgi:hypothetical protein
MLRPWFRSALLNKSKLNQFELVSRHLPEVISEHQACVRLLNRMTQLGMQKSVRIE